ncbi:UNVERIFIED_CONTAM: hypothetical protein K2H54_006696, partial [Gekko kuhli]
PEKWQGKYFHNLLDKAELKEAPQNLQLKATEEKLSSLVQRRMKLIYGYRAQKD